MLRSKLRFIAAILLVSAMPALSDAGLGDSNIETGPVCSPGAYLAQPEPGKGSVQFAPGILSSEGIQHSSPTFARDGREVYWVELETDTRPPKSRIWFMVEEEEGWTKPAIASFSGEWIDNSPCFAPDGQRLYFSSNRPGGFGKLDIWYIERMDSGWSVPINLGSPPNSAENETQMSVTEKGTVYFVGRMEGKEWERGIYVCRFIDGKYSEVEPLDSIINTTHVDYTPFIAGDESYLILASNRSNPEATRTELFISFRELHGVWTEPTNMGSAINNGFSVTFPQVTPDGGYLFFNRFNDAGTDAFYWIDAGVIDSLRP